MGKSARKTQVSSAVLQLRDLILDGVFQAHSRLPEVMLAERLGVSRTPLRQAMEQLVHEGILERMETGGCRVARFTSQDIFDAIELRGVLEGTAARLAAERGAAPDLLEETSSVLAELDAAVSGPSVDFDAYVAFNARYHELVALMSSSRVLQKEVKSVGQRFLSSPSAFLKSQSIIPDFQTSLVVAQAQHRAIYDAIRKREGARAEAVAREHARLARHNLEYVLKDKPNLVEQVPGLSLVANN